MTQATQDGHDPTLEALREHADVIGTSLVIIGGVALARHGYARSTTDRDVLVNHHQARPLAEQLLDDPAWEQLEIRQYCFLYRPTGIQVDFLVSRDLVHLGRPYLFPDVEAVETVEPIAGIPVIGLHDLLWLKLLASRARDFADIVELCKLHIDIIDPERVLKLLEPEDDDLRQRFLETLRQAPIELENERRFGRPQPPSEPAN
ncbi:MAG: nucleotidyl transferase AbiEii/AbiGii toxin family protein [Pirellulales bacterium]